MKKYILLIILLLSLFQVAYAIENTYPEIKLLDGTVYVINETSTFVDYVSYAFMMIIGIGAIILLVVFIWAGVNFIMAGGEPGKISKAREMIMNGFIGMIILLSAYWILTTINPGIIVDNPNLNVCSMGGIVLTITDGTKTTDKCINESNKNLDIKGTITAARWEYDYGGVKEVWAFSGKDFTGTSTAIFQDGTSGCEVPALIPVGTAISIPSGTKSIYIIPRLRGFYFYDKTNYGINQELPFYVGKSVNNISASRYSFDNKASSFTSVCSESKVVESPSGAKTYYYNEPKAIVFDNANYSGTCSLLYSPRSDSLNTPLEDPDKTYSRYIGNNKVSSIIVYNVDTETSGNPDQGRIILYNSLGCNKGDSTQHSICEININKHQSYTINMKNKTANFGGFPTGPGCADWDGSSDIQSIEIPDGKGAVVVIGNNGTCAYFDGSNLSQEGNCIGDLRGTGVYEGGSSSGVRPERVMVIPTN